MERDVLITIGGILTAKDDRDHPENVDVILPGTYYYKNGKHYVLYDETSEEVTGATHNRIRIENGQMTVTRRGLINTEMIFRPEQETATHYATPYGTMEMVIRTDSLEIRETENRLEAVAEYSLEINYEELSRNYIRVLVESQGKDSSFRLH